MSHPPGRCVVAEMEHTVDRDLPRDVDRARRLFLYLRDLAELRSKSTRDLLDYEEVTWLSDLPKGDLGWSLFDEGQPEVDPEVWLEVKRVQLPSVPGLPEGLLGWVRMSNLSRADLDEPGLLDPDERDFDPPTGLERDYEEYLNRHWKPWQQRYQELKPAFDFYSSLFSMSERRQSLGEVFEVVLGIGLLTWEHNGQRIRRHMITAPAELIVDDDTGVVDLRPSDAEGRNRFEVDMLELPDRGPVETLRQLTEEIEDCDPLALGDVAFDALRRWMNRAHATGRVNDSLAAVPMAQEPVVTLAPAIILRRRGQRTLSTLLNGIAEQITETGSLPEGVTRLITTEESDGSGGSIGFDDPEIYFPLPSNEEQAAILGRMKRRRGVVVQGPPGTGKSHTIANLVTHLLAQGKRVLVTSHTERALKVLKDKLPEEISPLCISLLGSDRQSIRDLEAAVESISARQGDWSEEASQREGDAHRSALHDIRSRLASAQNRLRDIREADSHQIEIGNYRGTSQHISRQLASESPQLSWIPDDVSEPVPPMANTEFKDYLELLWNLPPEAHSAADAQLPDPGDLVTAGDLEDLFYKEAEFARRRVDAASRYGEWVDDLGDHDDDTISETAMVLASYGKRLRELSNAAEWTGQAVADVIGGRKAVWDALSKELESHHDALDQALDVLGNATVEPNLQTSLSVLRAATAELISHAEQGKALRTGLLAMGAARDHREILEQARVDGAAPHSLEQLKLLEAYLSASQELEQIEQAWQGRVERFEGPSFSQRRAFYTHNLELLSQILALTSPLEEVRGTFDEVKALPRPSSWTDSESLLQVADGLKVELNNRQSAAISAAIDDAHRRIGDDSHPVVVELRSAIERRDSEAYRSALRSLSDARALAEQEQRRRELESKLAPVPLLRGALPESNDERWLERSSEFDKAWCWRHAHTELSRLMDPQEPRRLKADIEALEHRERATLAEITSLLAWSGMFHSLTAEQDQALTAWTHVIRRIGRGTGKYAEQHRRTARGYMNIARDAIPAWIMPTYRVAENLDVSPEPFDVVIVDEASQSGVESLFLFYIGRQVVVVGDDQQIAPEAVGIDMSEVARLQRQYLEDVPFKAEFGPTSSLFDQADIRFGNRVVLREHFRCMPEIIEFSNRISYPEKSLWPLRQYGADRLDPIKTVYLSHGYREGGRNAINRSEAEEIVARIEKICADPRYDEKTIGVISLQGDAQAKLIDQLLIERLGPQTMAERGLICGDAYAFQGDERDVMLLSMVAAPNANIGALSNAQARRRFNVAGSRAKDQVWLVHSVKAGELSGTDMRKALLEYYLDPDVERWEELANFDESVVNPPFESRFEQDVYLKLRERGFEVTPQHRVGGYRIDLVLRGSEAKLAVECDGDEWHGSRQWEDDSARQRRLERSGWAFVRIRGSDFYRDPESALADLWRRAERLSIEPHSTLEPARSTVEAPITGPEPESEETSADIEPPSRVSVSSPPVVDASEGATEVEPPVAEPFSKAVTADEVQEERNSEGLDASGSDMGLGVTVYHDRLGAGHITAIGRVRRSGEPWVRIRFQEDQFEYTPEEFERAGFRSEPPEDPATTRSQPVWQSPAPSNQHSVSQSSRPAHDESSDLKEYTAWTGDGFPDPRTADRSRVAEHLLSIVEVEGPITSDRAFKLYIKAAGYSRVTRQARGPLNKALYHLGDRVVFDELNNPETNWRQRVIRRPGTPEVILRELGERDLYEVPLNEIAAVMLSRKSERNSSTRQELMRYVLDAYGLSRLTRRAENYLQAAFELMSEHLDEEE